MALKTVHLKGLSKTNLPDCYQFDITVSDQKQKLRLNSDRVALWSHVGVVLGFPHPPSTQVRLGCKSWSRDCTAFAPIQQIANGRWSKISFSVVFQQAVLMCKSLRNVFLISLHSQITYENKDHNGQMLISLDTKEIPLKCHGHINFESKFLNKVENSWSGQRESRTFIHSKGRCESMEMGSCSEMTKPMSTPCRSTVRATESQSKSGKGCVLHANRLGTFLWINLIDQTF